MNIDLEELAAVVRLLKEAEFSEFRYAKGDVSLVVRRGELTADAAAPQPTPAALRESPPPPANAVPPPPPPPPTPTPAPVTVRPPDTQAARGPSSTVKAPLLGSFYGAPKPGEPPFVKIGDQVEPTTVVCIIEVMKLMNSVEAGVAGIVTAVHAGDGELVEHGQALFTIEQVGAT